MHAMLVLLSDTLAKGPILFRHLDEIYKDILQAHLERVGETLGKCFIKGARAFAQRRARFSCTRPLLPGFSTRFHGGSVVHTSTLPIWEEYLTRVPMRPCLPRH